MDAKALSEGSIFRCMSLLVNWPAMLTPFGAYRLSKSTP